MIRHVFVLLLLSGASFPVAYAATEPDPERDILVTFENSDARNYGVGANAPYRMRKRYSIAEAARSHARDVEKQYALTLIRRWPIDSLKIYCFVYRIPDDVDRDALVEKMRADTRIESVQALHSFEANAAGEAYDDQYASLQHGLGALDILLAHRYSTGENIRVAIIDSHADTRHEDLRGRVARQVEFTESGLSEDADHGTAVASVIGAIANNAIGIVGVAPEADLEVYVSCWRDAGRAKTVCDSFTLAKALDAVLRDPPDILNLSLTGPDDALLARMLRKAVDAGVVVVAAEPDDPHSSQRFPANLAFVIGVASSRQAEVPHSGIFAPGTGILVARPNDNYELQSGSSLAAAHVSGIVALLLAASPDVMTSTVEDLLQRSQLQNPAGEATVNACALLQLADSSRQCNQKENETLNTSRDSARSGVLTSGTH